MTAANVLSSFLASTLLNSYDLSWIQKVNSLLHIVPSFRVCILVVCTWKELFEERIRRKNPIFETIILTEPEVTPGPGHYRADRVRCGVMSAERTPRAVTLVGKERYTWKSWAPPPSKYAVPATFGTGSVDKAGGKSWSIGVGIIVQQSSCSSTMPSPTQRSLSLECMSRRQLLARTIRRVLFSPGSAFFLRHTANN